MTKKIKILLAICAAILVALLAWSIWENKHLVLTEYTIQNPEIPTAFDGFRIAQVSDLHNEEFGENNERLIAMLRSAQPDIIAITGDLIDSRTTNIAVTLEFARQAMEIAPCYYVPGNHESRLEEYGQLFDDLAALGVTVLEDTSVTLQRDGQSIYLLGVLDPSFKTDYVLTWEAKTMEESLIPIFREEGFTILLSHRPKFLDLYVKYKVDLVLSGHNHGGQVRLPFVGGLYSPDEGFFPEYDAGFLERENTQMIISRGIGDSVIPLRINNPPEVVLITLTPNP